MGAVLAAEVAQVQAVERGSTRQRQVAVQPCHLASLCRVDTLLTKFNLWLTTLAELLNNVQVVV